MSGVDTGYFTQSGGDIPERVFRHPEDVHLDMVDPGYAKFGGHLARQEIQILEALKNTRERAGIRVSDYSQT